MPFVGSSIALAKPLPSFLKKPLEVTFMKRQTKLSEQQLQHHAAGQELQQSSPQEFATVEEMLRHDAVHTPVPPAIAHRLQESIGQLPAPPRSWWRRLFE